MPNCFTLTKKGESKPSEFITIDVEICEHLGVPCDDIEWYLAWYDIIGFRLATGQTFDDIKIYFNGRLEEGSDSASEYLRIVEFLSENYTANAWVEIGKR